MFGVRPARQSFASACAALVIILRWRLIQRLRRADSSCAELATASHHALHQTKEPVRRNGPVVR
jgi:hypothetical protein